MNITLACPKCERPARLELEPETSGLICPHCAATIDLPLGALVDGRLSRCLACSSRDVYLRKDFPQRLGVLIVVLGIAASCVTWAYNRPIWTFAILFATALVDVALYVVMPSALVCYHCGAQYRGLPHADDYEGFSLETHERHRQQRIRRAEHERSAASPVVRSQAESDNSAG
jgi:hypothetical protein